MLRPRTGVPRECLEAATPVPIVGQSAKLLSVCDMARRVADGPAKVLITGESGVGKELIAGLIHQHSPRADKPLVAVNCAIGPETLLESQLFGHVKGAFTDASRDRIGVLLQADGGTIFLDEVAEMSLRMQAMLLRFLECGEVRPVGAGAVRTAADVRIIAATNKDLGEAVAAGTFREDLMYRLDVVHLHVPPLRDRPEDVRPLVAHFVEKSGRPVRFTEGALRAFEAFRWPGNVRDLQNTIEQIVWTSESDVIDVGDLPPRLMPGRPDSIHRQRERRRRRADDLMKALTDGSLSFWDHVHPLFLARDLTRQDLRQLLHLGLEATRGSYQALVRLFGMPDSDYKRLLNFLSSHDCVVDFRPYRALQKDDHAGDVAAEPPRTAANGGRRTRRRREPPWPDRRLSSR
jgi:DNA-binding NtrC family response regulator